MPHFTIEYSKNLEDQVDISRLCAEVLRAALATGVFEVGAVRVRAIACSHYAIADRQPGNGFIDVSLRMGAGRELALKQRVGEAVFAAMADFLAPQSKSKHFALSFEIREIDAALSWKKNSIHDRLRSA
jgi:5-carboxymethyl-2-hydroxymuconate isomerase